MPNAIKASTSFDPDFCDPFKEKIALITNYFTVCKCTNTVFFSKFAFRHSRSVLLVDSTKSSRPVQEIRPNMQKKDNQTPYQSQD